MKKYRILITGGAGYIGVKTDSYNWGFMGKATDEAPNIEVPRGKIIGGSNSLLVSPFP